MSYLANFLLPLAIPSALLLAGYWISARATRLSPAERLAFAVLAGLGLTLWSVSTINLVKPLSGAWAWLCLWPVGPTLLSSAARLGLARDLVEVFTARRGQIAAALAGLLVVFLLWPLFSRPSLVFYDGTSNHDAFFWIVAAEHLKEHTYLQEPVATGEHPLHHSTPAIVGLRPDWGRMGAEGFLALTSSLTGLETIKIYVSATVALLVPWIAAVFLAVRTFLVGRLGSLALLSLVALQPVFVYFHGNSNLPNLIGALMAAATVVATERSLRESEHRRTWLVLLTISFHGVACSYPELLPFVIMPAGLLWLRSWFARGPRAVWRPATATALAWIAGAAVNPASTLRAWFGFVASFNAARANESWANLFAPLSVLEYVPALATLAVGASLSLSAIFSAFLTVALCVGLVLALRGASDRMGSFFLLSGAFALLVYTLAEGFSYGWQKTVQFGGAFWAAFFPVALIEAFSRVRPAKRSLRLLTWGALLALSGFFLYATILNGTDGHKWSERKLITKDWFALREHVRAHLPKAPILVDSASFSMAFFHGMWAAYFLADNPIYFAARGNENGGYIRGIAITEVPSSTPTPTALLVSRNWADTFDANSERLFNGDTVALVRKSNRVIRWEGLHPNNGVPDLASEHIILELKPHSASHLLLECKPLRAHEQPTVRWRATVHVNDAETFSTEVVGAAPWQFDIPLQAAVVQRIELVAESHPPTTRPFPFKISALRIEATR